MTSTDIPANIEAEQAVLGSILLDASTLSLVEYHLTGEMFHLARHADIFDAMQHLSSKGTPIDIITLSARLEAKKQLADIGGLAYLAELMAVIPTPIHAEHYARLVANAHARRKIIELSSDMASMAYNDTGDIAVLLERIQSATQSMVPRKDSAMLRWEDSFDFWLRGQEERHANRDKPRLDMPWPSLTNFVRYLRGGMLCVVAAESGIGKTLFAETLAEHWAQHGFQVLFCHYELSHQVMLDRRTVRLMGPAMDAVEWGVVSEGIREEQKHVQEWPGAVHYYHCSGMPIIRLASLACNEVRQGRADVVIVDYLQKAPMWEHVHGMNTAQMRGGDVEILKNLAETESIPIVLLSQMNRESYGMVRKTSSTIRDTGEAHERANVVITLNRKILDEATDGFAEGDRSPHLRVRVDKNTLGRTGETELYADAKHFRIVESERVDLAEDTPPPPRPRAIPPPRQARFDGEKEED